jgi:tetratricopeptide (TPR) repeat protein
MIQAWRRRLKQAEEAYKVGQLDEAGRILREGELVEYLPGKRLSAKVADQIARRAKQRAAAGDTSAGWRDLEEARSLGGDTGRWVAVRGELVAEALDEVEKYLQAGDAAKAVARLERLQRHDVQNKRLRTLREVARHLESAERLSRHGKFAEAESQLAAAVALAPDWKFLAERKRSCRRSVDASRRLSAKLHQAMSAGRWTLVLKLSERLLEIAPESRVAREARSAAWQKVGAKVSHGGQLAETQVWQSDKPAAKKRVGATQQQVAGGRTLTNKPPGPRYVLWIDAVGGYLVCRGDQITIGQAIPGNRVDVPIQADLRGKHAVIRREDEQYLIEPIGPVRVEGRAIESAALLSDGDEIQLGESVRLRFRRPHPLSASARLELISSHRCPSAPEGVLLMAESCVLGPREGNHVVCRDWSDDVILFWQADQLHCRAGAPFEIDGKLCDGRGPLRPGAHVAGEDFSLSLEEV